MFNSNQLGKLSDRDLLAQSRAYEVLLSANPAGLNFTGAVSDGLKNFNNAFETSLDEFDTVRLEGEAKRVAKDGNRENVLGDLRRQRNVVYADTSITDATRASYGIPPRDQTKTATPKPSTAPMGRVEYGKLKHTIHFRDAATPDRKAKPKGARGCEIWHFIGTAPPAAESDYRYLATDSDSPYVAFYEMADAGKTVYYMLRWVSNTGETGEWSETIQATVNG